MRAGTNECRRDAGREKKDSDWGLVGSDPERIFENWLLGNRDKEPGDATLRAKTSEVNALRLGQNNTDFIFFLRYVAMSDDAQRESL